MSARGSVDIYAYRLSVCICLNLDNFLLVLNESIFRYGDNIRGVLNTNKNICFAYGLATNGLYAPNPMHVWHV